MGSTAREVGLGDDMVITGLLSGDLMVICMVICMGDMVIHGDSVEHFNFGRSCPWNWLCSFINFIVPKNVNSRRDVWCVYIYMYIYIHIYSQCYVAWKQLTPLFWWVSFPIQSSMSSVEAPYCWWPWPDPILQYQSDLTPTWTWGPRSYHEGSFFLADDSKQAFSMTVSFLWVMYHLFTDYRYHQQASSIRFYLDPLFLISENVCIESHLQGRSLPLNKHHQGKQRGTWLFTAIHAWSAISKHWPPSIVWWAPLMIPQWEFVICVVG